jgi:hypothetical protein
MQFKLSAYLVAMLLTLNIAAKTIGSLQPPNPAMKGFTEGCDNKPQPCWYGIVPGETKPNEAKQKLQEYGLALRYETSMELTYTEPLSSCSVSLTFQESVRNYSHVFRVSFFQCQLLHAGDIMLLPGKKERLSNGIAFFDGSAFGSVTVSTNTSAWVSSPLTLFTGFTLIPLNNIDREVRYKWHGFIPLGRYCQLEPKFRQC